jgi:ketosteroid isomerase-like protein
MGSFDETLGQYHRALEAFYNGDCGPTKELYSRSNDAVLAGAYGDLARGWARISDTLDFAVAHFGGGRSVQFENVVKTVTNQLAYLVEIERFEAKLGGAKDWTHIALRVTTIFQREGESWKIVHRQGDQLVSRIDTSTYQALLRAQR